MVILIASIVVFIASLVALTILIRIRWNDNKKSSGWGKKGFYLLPLSLLSFLILIFGMFSKVNANEVGIIYHDKYGILDEVKYEGFQRKSIFEHITTISTTNKTKFLEVYAQTKDSINAQFEITITYKVESKNAGKFYKAVGDKKISDEQLNTLIKESLQSISTAYDIFQIMGGELDEVRSKVADSLEIKLNERYHITLVSLSIDDVDAGARVESIIQEKAEAIQKIEIAERDQQRATIEAQTELLRAKNKAEVDIAIAKGKAEADELLNAVAVNAILKMYNSQFETEALKADFEDNNKGGYLKIQEVGEIVVKQLYYDVWDGKLPTVVTDGSGIIIQP
ncbi:SPFH domain-containing protein [Haploplasma axanthum]|uniref:SPFH domain / Band 7 family n=1 Tax=Haploplasma axanthum TaxID=29552 RepID=A0A449BCW6_HAPAX|nr:SPFH domain-containing protein [Haploplasma axanthum]VEU80257.1 SPFH domain / Band 7 family [Haploplasma axanthum]